MLDGVKWLEKVKGVDGVGDFEGDFLGIGE